MPICRASSGSRPYRKGYRNMERVPKSTTVATAMAVWCCSAPTAARCQHGGHPADAAARAQQQRGLLARPSSRVPSTQARTEVEAITKRSTSRPAGPRASTCWKAMRKPYRQMPARSSRFLLKESPGCSAPPSSGCSGELP
ncbi:unnamed protein product [Heterosigma akashiwo]